VGLLCAILSSVYLEIARYIRLSQNDSRISGGNDGRTIFFGGEKTGLASVLQRTHVSAGRQLPLGSLPRMQQVQAAPPRSNHAHLHPAGAGAAVVKRSKGNFFYYYSFFFATANRFFFEFFSARGGSSEPKMKATFTADFQYFIVSRIRND